MTVKQFRKEARRKQMCIKIPVKLIRLVSDIHIDVTNCDVFALEKPVQNLLVIVHKNDDGTYDLIMGWKDYVVAVRDNLEEINAVLVKETNRDEFLHRLSTRMIWLKLNDINIPKCFSSHPPKEEKLNTYKNQIKTAIERYSLSDYLNAKPITIDKNNVLVDGYTRYLVLKELNYKQEIPVIRKD